jgi:hypothetical protein
MDDNKAKGKDKTKKPQSSLSSSTTTSSLVLNNYQHRQDKDPVIETKEGLVLEATPAQRERVIFMVDDALTTLDELNRMGPPRLRLEAAKDILNRAGLVSKQGGSEDYAGGQLAPSFIRDAIIGIAAMFGRAITDDQASRMAAHDRNKSASSKEESFFDGEAVFEPKDVTPISKPKPSKIPESLFQRIKES